MKTAEYIEKFSDNFFGDESIAVQRKYFSGEISALEYDLICAAILNDFYRAMLQRGRKR